MHSKDTKWFTDRLKFPYLPTFWILGCTISGAQKGDLLTRHLGQTACPRQGRRRVETGGVPSGAHGATNKEHHVCTRRRVGEAGPWVPVEDFDESRTPLADFFSILLVLAWFTMGQYNHAMLWCVLLSWASSAVWLAWVEPRFITARIGCSYGTHRRCAGYCHDSLFRVTGNHSAITERLYPLARALRGTDGMAEIREEDGKAFTDIRINHGPAPREGVS